MTRFYLHDGAYHEARGNDLPEGAVEVPRLPGLGEHWDVDAGKMVCNAGMAADMVMPVGAIDQAHAIKALEAAIILSGFVLTHGILADEAQATGEDIKALAARVHGKTNKFRAAEVARRRIKTGTDNGS